MQSRTDRPDMHIFLGGISGTRHTFLVFSTLDRYTTFELLTKGTITAGQQPTKNQKEASCQFSEYLNRLLENPIKINPMEF
jgi:hypothetical protein